MKTLLSYKGILFDDFTKNEDGTYWAEICQEHAVKYADLLSSELDEGGHAIGICSVNGCYNDGSNEEVQHFYVDFDPEHVKFVSRSSPIEFLEKQLKSMYGETVRNIVFLHEDEAGYWYQFSLAHDERLMTWCVRHTDLKGGEENGH